MMFDTLTDKLTLAFKRFTSKGRLTPEDVEVGLREVRARLARDGVKKFAKALDVLGVVDLEPLHDDLVAGLLRTCSDFAPEMVVRRGVQKPGDCGELLAPLLGGGADEHHGERALAGDLGR